MAGMTTDRGNSTLHIFILYLGCMLERERFHLDSEVAQLCPTLPPHGLSPVMLLRSWDFPGKNTGVACQFPSPGICPTQGSIAGLLRCRWTLLSAPPGNRVFLRHILTVLSQSERGEGITRKTRGEEEGQRGVFATKIIITFLSLMNVGNHIMIVTA